MKADKTVANVGGALRGLRRKFREVELATAILKNDRLKQVFPDDAKVLATISRTWPKKNFEVYKQEARSRILWLLSHCDSLFDEFEAAARRARRKGRKPAGGAHG